MFLQNVLLQKTELKAYYNTRLFVSFLVNKWFLNQGFVYLIVIGQNFEFLPVRF
jgi:hypothetical protein